LRLISLSSRAARRAIREVVEHYSGAAKIIASPFGSISGGSVRRDRWGRHRPLEARLVAVDCPPDWNCYGWSLRDWIPAFAGMTRFFKSLDPRSKHSGMTIGWHPAPGRRAGQSSLDDLGHHAGADRA